LFVYLYVEKIAQLKLKKTSQVSCLIVRLSERNNSTFFSFDFIDDGDGGFALSFAEKNVLRYVCKRPEKKRKMIRFMAH
jgi:hypothetical protein